MPPTLLSGAFGLLLGMALLGAAFSRRSITVVTAAAMLPDLDAVASLIILGATNSLLHNLWLPAIAGVVLYWDGKRATPWLRTRYGWCGQRVAWVALAAYVGAGIGVDLFSYEGVNLFYPVHDSFYGIAGWLIYSTQDGLIETYLGVGAGDTGLHVAGTTATHHIPTWVNPTPGMSNPDGAERRVTLLKSGWQAVVVVTSIVAVTIRGLEQRVETSRKDPGSSSVYEASNLDVHEDSYETETETRLEETVHNSDTGTTSVSVLHTEASPGDPARQPEPGNDEREAVRGGENPAPGEGGDQS